MKEIRVTAERSWKAYAKAATAELRDAGGVVLVARNPQALRKLKGVQRGIQHYRPDAVALRVRDDEKGLWRLLVFRSGDEESYQAAREAS